MQLFRLCLPDIVRSKVDNLHCFISYPFRRCHVSYFNYIMFLFLQMQISTSKKFNLIFLFFLLRKLILPFYSFTLFCIILPMTMFIPEAELPAWVVCYIPATMSFLNILPAPKSFPFIVPYLLFENTMSVTKFNAMVSGLFQLGSAYEWVVTKKSGRSSEGDLVSMVGKKDLNNEKSFSTNNLEEIELIQKQENKLPKKKHNRIYMKELALAFLLLTASARSLLSAQGIHFYFLMFQGISFLLVGLDLIGEQVAWNKSSRSSSENKISNHIKVPKCLELKTTLHCLKDYVQHLLAAIFVPSEFSTFVTAKFVDVMRRKMQNTSGMVKIYKIDLILLLLGWGGVFVATLSQEARSQTWTDRIRFSLQAENRSSLCSFGY